MFQLKLEPSAEVEFFHDPAMVVLVLVFASSICVHFVPSFIFACLRRGVFVLSVVVSVQGSFLGVY